MCNRRMHTSVHHSYLLFQYLALGGLGIPKVHKFIKQLVDEDKVVPNTLLFQLPKILLKHLWRDGGEDKGRAGAREEEKGSTM